METTARTRATTCNSFKPHAQVSFHFWPFTCHLSPFHPFTFHPFTFHLSPFTLSPFTVHPFTFHRPPFHPFSFPAFTFHRSPIHLSLVAFHRSPNSHVLHVFFSFSRTLEQLLATVSKTTKNLTLQQVGGGVILYNVI